MSKESKPRNRGTSKATGGGASALLTPPKSRRSPNHHARGDGGEQPPVKSPNPHMIFKPSRPKLCRSHARAAATKNYRLPPMHASSLRPMHASSLRPMHASSLRLIIADAFSPNQPSLFTHTGAATAVRTQHVKPSPKMANVNDPCPRVYRSAAVQALAARCLCLSARVRPAPPPAARSSCGSPPSRASRGTI
eukprot:6209009-Pleurochrysis_carterae.AAC.2